MREMDARDERVMELPEFNCVVRCYRKTKPRRNRPGVRSKTVFRFMSPAEYEADKLTRANKKR